MTWRPSKETRELIESIGGRERIYQVTKNFYSKMFDDNFIDKFVRNKSADKHGERIGSWIIEKLTGDTEWSKTRPIDSRSKSHYKAWTSPLREPEHQGRRFKLDDCRIWMRLFFWAARSEGLAENEEVWELLVDFIGHFIAVYERTAPPYARESSEWSSNPRNIEKYKNDGYLMNDVIGKQSTKRNFFD